MVYSENQDSFKITIQPTNRCNLACTYCYQESKGNVDLDFKTIKIFFDKFFDHNNIYFNGFLRDNYENIILDFIGGEATLNMTLVNDVVSYFIKKCIEYKKINWLYTLSIWLQTNGTTYFKDDVQAFLKQYHAKVDLPITIDGSKECHDTCRKYHNGKGSYNTIEKAIKSYMEPYHREPNTKITISPSNVHSTFSALKNMVDLGYTGCRMSCTNNEQWTEEEDKVFIEQLEQFYKYIEDNNIFFSLHPYLFGESYTPGLRCSLCGTAGNSICIDCHGKLYLCQAFSDICSMNGKPGLSIGHVATGISDEGIAFINTIKEKNASLVENLKDTECATCPSAGLCEYCPAMDYFLNGMDHPAMYFKVGCRKNKEAYRLYKEHLERLNNKNKGL